jgi:hypothetical protein
MKGHFKSLSQINTAPVPIVLSTYSDYASHLVFSEPEPCLLSSDITPSVMRTPRFGFWRGKLFYKNLQKSHQAHKCPVVWSDGKVNIF